MSLIKNQGLIANLVINQGLIRGGSEIRWAPNFDGVAQYALAVNPENLRIADGDDFEIGVTVRRDNWNGGGFALCSRQNSSYGVNFYMSNNGDSGTGSIGVFGTSLSASGFSAGVEYKVSLSRVSDRTALNVNGVEVDSETNLTMGAIPNITAMSLMARDDNSFMVRGTARDFYLKVNGNMVYFNSLGMKDSAAQPPSTGYGDIQIVNHTDAMWEEL